MRAKAKRVNANSIVLTAVIVNSTRSVFNNAIIFHARIVTPYMFIDVIVYEDFLHIIFTFRHAYVVMR